MRRVLPIIVMVGAALGAAACGVGDDTATQRALPPLTQEPSTTTTSTTAPPGTTTTVVPCDDPTPSYAPLPNVPSTAEAATADRFMQELVTNGQLRVAVDENTKYLAARDPMSSRLEGVEILIAKRIAQRLFGSENVRFKTVTTKQKLAFLQEEQVDLSISAISMTCERWQDVAFSSVYLVAEHRFLVRDDSEIEAEDDIAGKRVCVTAGSTSVDILETINKRFAGQDRKPVVIVLGDARTDCLLQVQEGMVDAYLGHDTFLTGMSESNPALRTVPQGQQQPYGIAIGSANTYFVRYVNAVLAELRQSGELQTWLDSTPLGKDVPPVGDTRPLP
jgi:polar amino acid transport system substrate-binding protein